MSHITTDAGENAKNLRSAERFFLYTSRSAFLFAVADNDVVREDCSAILRFSLLGKGKTLHIHDWERDGEGFYPVEQLRRLLQNYPDTDGLILCGLDAALYHNPHFLEQLNFGREALSSFGIPMLFWLSSDAMRKLNWEALDLFSQRSGGTLYFTDGNENGAYAAGDISCKVYETDFDKPLLRALEARLQLLQHQLEEAEQQQAEPAIRANDVAIELLRLYLRMPGKRDAVQALLERYSHDFDLEKPAISADVANAYARTGESEKARLLLEKALLCYRKLALTNSEAYRSSVAKTLKSLAQVHSTIRDFHAAEGEYGEALALFRQLAAANPRNWRAEVAATLGELAELHVKRDAFAAAEREHEEALVIYRELAEANPRRWLPRVAATLNTLSTIQTMLNEMTKATEGYQEALKITGELDSAVTWLHISDLHLSLRGRYDQEVILRALVASVTQFREEGRVPDLIVVTGDIALGGKAEEYRQATLFFDDLLAAACLDKRRLFIVPGNHDVDRTVNEFLPRTLDSDASSDRFFDPAGVALGSQFQKLQAYGAWYNGYFAAIRSFSTGTTCSAVELVQVRQVRVAMLLLNSVLFSIDDHDHGKLLLGRRCLDKATIALQEHSADLTIALLHYPLDWLSSVERANIRATLGASVDLLLHGHYHEIETESMVSQHGGYLKLGAGASYQTREWPNCAMYATAQCGQVTIFPICYHDKPREVWALDTALFPSPSYIATFPLPKRLNPATREPQDLKTLDGDHLHDYHEALRRELDISNLLGTHALDNVPVGLTDTFVALRLSDTWRCDSDLKYGEACELSEQDREKGLNEQIRKPEEVMRLVFEQQRLLLIIGDPGSGKTTLLKHYALTALDNRQKLGFTEPLLVVFLPLRDLIVENGDYARLSRNLIAWSKLHNLDIEEKHLSRWLQQRPTLLLFDGLDEISDPKQRITACRWIDRIVASSKKAQVVVTSRSTGYRKAEGIELASRHTRADIMDFTSEQQKDFLEKWFRAAYLGELKPGSVTQERWEKSQKEKAERKAKDIVAFLAQEKNRGVQALARVPLLLQIMAMLWKDRDYLPASRLKLYEAALNYILDYRDRQKGLEPLLPAEDALRVLAPVSLWMQELVKRDEVERSAMQQQMQLQLKTLTRRYSAEEFCKNLVDRAGLLVEYRDREYLFRHKSFREYMAGLQLLKECGREQRMGTLAGYFGDDWWNEPLRFFIGQADASTFDAFMRELFNSPVSEEMTPKQQDLLTTLIEEAPQISFDALQSKLMKPETSLNRQRYLVQCLNAIGELDAHKEALEVVKQFNLSGLSKEKPFAAGILIDPLGAEYLLIKGGSFDYSLTKKRETVPDLYVAKFTVTNRLFRRFIGYLESQEGDFARVLPLATFTKELRALAKSIKEFSGWLQEEKKWSKQFVSWYDDDKRFNKDDQPVIATWYAARAYCLWLSLLESKGRDTLRYRLPKEMEWEFAASGEEGRPYPWPKERGEPTPKLANYNSNEGSTTPVGRYPEGATPEGLFDMAGNVWEWTDDWYDNDKDVRSLRGAYYNSKADALRCSSRYFSNPWIFNSYNVGFRVIRSSHSFLPEHLIL